jgi:MTH538 TIR-like domain (DUF1863).
LRVYYVYPKITIGENQLAEQFTEKCFGEIEEHVEVVSLRSETVMLSADVNKGDSIVFFNRSDQNYKDSFIKLLGKTLKAQCLIYPIALTIDHRKPPVTVEMSQSFDIVEELRQRCLTESNIATAAFSLARKVISDMQPTLCKDKMHMFISYRRDEGEDISALFYKEFKSRAEEVFRDLIDINVGENAQDIIEKKLKKSDIVIFLDTPKAGESRWITKELEMAFALNIPIVWIRIGDLKNREPLKFNPADIPHFMVKELSYADKNQYVQLIDDIIHKAFQISRESVKSVFDQINNMESIAINHQADFKKLDSRNLIFKLSMPRNGLKYRQRPLVHLVQCYGRLPKVEDKEKLKPVLKNLGYEEHPEHGSYFDSALLLAPIVPSNGYQEDTYETESFDEYIYYLNNYLNPIKNTSNEKKGIIISGAFPDCEPDRQQALTDAVYAFTHAVFQRNGIVIFGAHPTFQHLIFNVGKQIIPNSYKEHIHLYISEYFASRGMIEDLRHQANVISTKNVEDDRNKSLTLMRKTMIEDSESIALICMGGKTKAGGHNPGVDEEIELAFNRGLPVFIIGSVGGRSAEIAVQLESDGWAKKLNNLSIEDNTQLMVSIDYRTMANKLLRFLGL